MAQVEVFGFDDLNELFSALEDVPFEVTSRALNAMAEAGERALERTGTAMGVYDPESRTHILDAIYHTKPKQNRDGGGYCVVTFRGKRRRGNTVTSNALIAFEQEYGNRHQAANPFVRVTAVQSGDEIAKPGENVLDEWIVRTAETK